MFKLLLISINDYQQIGSFRNENQQFLLPIYIGILFTIDDLSIVCSYHQCKIFKFVLNFCFTHYQLFAKAADIWYIRILGNKSLTSTHWGMI